MKATAFWFPLVALLACLAAQAQVPFDRIRDAETEPESWLTFSGDYSSHHHSQLGQINRQNVGLLRPAWVYQLERATNTAFETSPLIADGVVYLTRPGAGALALDAKTGRRLWSYSHRLGKGLVLCCGAVNRGAAILGNLLFFGTPDAHLVALDARTGSRRWDVVVAEYRHGYSITGAPLAVNDKIIVGMAGGEYGVRGFLDAYEAATGKRAWRLWTVPEPGQPGSETWAGDSWKTGAAATWTTGSYDPGENLVLWATGNPGPPWNGEVRKGDNLYSNSLLAVDADTGELRWHFQFTPHDVWDFDSTQVPVLVDRRFGGEPRKLVLFANRNGFFYVLDRQNGAFLLGKPYAKQTWAKGLDDNGRPIVFPEAVPSTQGVMVEPDPDGVTNWYSPSYSPQTDQFFVAVRKTRATYFKHDDPRPALGRIFSGGGNQKQPEREHSGAILALSPETGDVVWRRELDAPPWGGVLSTAGGVLFGSTADGWFFGLDQSTGRLLWRFNTGGTIRANPVTYLHEGRQYVALAAGSNLFTFSLSESAAKSLPATSENRGRD